MKLLIAAMRLKYTFDLTKNVLSTPSRKFKQMMTETREKVVAPATNIFLPEMTDRPVIFSFQQNWKLTVCHSGEMKGWDVSINPNKSLLPAHEEFVQEFIALVDRDFSDTSSQLEHEK